MERINGNSIYKVIASSYISKLDIESLENFYSPVIGPLSISLYLLLLKDLNKEKNHLYLMNHFDASIEEILKARYSLEACGLLRTYFDGENYIYDLYSPLYPNEFLHHPIFNVVLLNKIGKEEFDKLVIKYSKKKENLTGYDEITKKMDEVFKVQNYNEIDGLIDRKEGSIGLTSNIDYEEIKRSIPKDLINEKTFNKRTTELIDNLSFIYNVDTKLMTEFIRKSLNEFGMIDKEELRIVVRKYYELGRASLPTIVYRSQPDYLKKKTSDSSLRSKAIAMFENVSPYDFLKMKNKGGNPTNKDLKLIESLIVDLGLTPAVVNVLIDYVLRKNSNRLTENYVNAIASQWKRQGLKTAEEAMNFAGGEHKKMQKGIKEKNNNKDIPKWFNENGSKKEMSKEEIDELENMLKEFK